MATTVKILLPRGAWEEIGDRTGWAEDIGFGTSKFKFYSGPGSFCVCPFCGRMKKHVMLMPCEKMLCPWCGHAKMENRYIERGLQMSPEMFGKMQEVRRMRVKLAKSLWEKAGLSKGWIKKAQDGDIFEQYGMKAKQYDALSGEAARRNLTPGEKKFVDTFAAMLNGDASEQDMEQAWQAWMATPQAHSPSKTAQVEKNWFPQATYQYYINLDERGYFYADVRNSSGKTVFEIKAGDSLPEGQTSIFEDGFMKHKDDLEGLRKYLVQLGIMKEGQTLVRGN